MAATHGAAIWRCISKWAGCIAALAIAIVMLRASPAMADFRLCNNASDQIGVALGYRGSKDWVSKGWWNIDPHACETLLRGPLAGRYFYIHVVDYGGGKDWSGQSYLCSRQKKFTIQGAKNCQARGYDKTSFIQIDTGKQHSWTVHLTDKLTTP